MKSVKILIKKYGKRKKMIGCAWKDELVVDTSTGEIKEHFLLYSVANFL